MKKTLLSILILTAILLSACGNAATPVPRAVPAADENSSTGITAEGTLLPGQSAELAFAQGGVLKEILVQPGERVEQDDVIARLIGLESVQAEFAAAKLEQTLALQALDAIHRNALQTSSQTEQALLNAQEAYESQANGWNLGNEDEASNLELRIEDYVLAEEDYRSARQKLDDVLHLDKDDSKRMNRQDDFDAEKENIAQAYADLKIAIAENEKSLDEKIITLLGAISTLETARELQSRLDTANLDPEILAVAESRLEAATARVAAAEAAVELYELRAPFNGILLRMDLAAGETVFPSTPIAFVADTSQWIIETKDLAEVDIAKISIGNPVTVKMDAFVNEEFTGKVTKIDPVGRLYLGDMTYRITVALDEPDPRFLWNMTAVITVNTDGD
jgi:multidrug efflux pump subunit AcrA (membrane-fusion protein)